MDNSGMCQTFTSSDGFSAKRIFAESPLLPWCHTRKPGEGGSLMFST